jgi:hypothetical protein
VLNVVLCSYKSRRETHFYKKKKKLPDKDDECDLCFLNYFTAKSMNKVIGCVVRNVMSGATKCALVRKARDNVHMADSTDCNCTYGGTFSINCKEFSNFLIQLHRTCFSTDTLSCSCILHGKACFACNDRNCTTLPYIVNISRIPRGVL